METDALAIARSQAGDTDAFRELVEQHGRAVFRVAYRVTGRVEDAEDVVQETFLRAFRQLDRFEGRANIGTWLHRIAANCAIDLLRARPAREFGKDDSTLERLSGQGDGRELDSPERQLFGTQIGDRVQRAMGLLTDLERAAFTLRHFEGCSIDEVSRTLGLSAVGARHSIFRAVKKMRQQLRPFIEV